MQRGADKQAAKIARWNGEYRENCGENYQNQDFKIYRILPIVIKNPVNLKTLWILILTITLHGVLPYVYETEKIS